MSILLVTLCVALAMAGIAFETTARKRRPATAPWQPQHADVSRRPSSLEEQRWIAVLTVPLAAGAVSVAAALATDVRWFFVGAILLVPTWIGALAYLALSSDVNGRGGDPA